MKILITGNMGYIGPVVTKYLHSTYPEAELLGIDIGYFGNCINASDVLPECELDVQYFSDIRSFPENILNGVDAVVHQFEEVTLAINHKASIDLANKAKKAGVKSFVFASSCSMYGTADDSARTEDSPLNPLTAYAKSKALPREI